MDDLALVKQALEGKVVTEVSADQDDDRVQLCIETKRSKIILYLDRSIEDSAFVVEQDPHSNTQESE